MEIPAFLAHWPLQALLALIAGLAILLVPRALNYAVAIYLLGVGALGLLHFVNGGPVDARAAIALVAGVLVLLRPNILNYVVGVYLILVGLLEAGILRF
ncbi:hypothetical protein CKO41_07595 [Thiococcus pfennigii]|nr:hypothetical protein [Thiococcus pfennigii]MBK1731657.1 hypothetical protein [Thiococcus pfennigii]